MVHRQYIWIGGGDCGGGIYWQRPKTRGSQKEASVLLLAGLAGLTS